MAQDTAQQAPTAPATPARVLLPSILPALVVGVSASLLLLVVTGAAERLEDVLWQDLPDALGAGRYSALWMLVVLTSTGVLVGLVVWKAAGHAGPDPATTGLDARVLPPMVLPGLLVAAGLMPAGSPSQGPLWEGGFAPLAAASAASMTTTLVAHPSFDLGPPPLGRPDGGALLTAVVIASAGALLAMCAVRAFPVVHGALTRLRHTMPALSAGGVVLGLLGALGGPLTRFKGLDEIGEPAADPGGWSAGQLATMTVVKLTALVVAASCGFRGGQIFPAVFVGSALGLTARALVPGPSVGGRGGRRAGRSAGHHPAGLAEPVRRRRPGRLGLGHRPALRRLAAGLAAGDGPAADAVTRRRNGGAMTA